MGDTVEILRRWLRMTESKDLVMPDAKALRIEGLVVLNRSTVILDPSSVMLNPSVVTLNEVKSLSG